MLLCCNCQAQELHGTAEERNQQLSAQLEETKQELQRYVMGDDDDDNDD